MDLDNLSSNDIVQLVMALEEAFPGLEWLDDPSPEELIDCFGSGSTIRMARSRLS